MVGLCFESCLEIILRLREVALASCNVPEIEKAGRIVRVKLQPFHQIFASLVIAAKVPVAQAHKSIGSSRRSEVNQGLEFPDSSIGLPRRKVTVAKRSVE